MGVISEEFICKCLEELFGYPCDFTPPESELHNTEHNCNWCEKNCGKASAADCWLHYFVIKTERNQEK